MPYRKVVDGKAKGPHLNIVVVSGLDEEGIHALWEVGEDFPVCVLKYGVSRRDDAAGSLERDGDDSQGRVKDAGSVIREFRSYRVWKVMGGT